MQLRKQLIIILLTGLGGLAAMQASGQIVISKQEKIPDSVYEKMPPPSEKLAKKKFTLKRKWYQNLVTRDNYYFNARMKLQRILEDARYLHVNQYDSLLSFYPFSTADLETSAGDLDSVIQKASIGIGIHDPRGKWIDNLYLLAGRAYYYKNDFGNAIAAFQYINRHFAPHGKKEETPVIGSRGTTPKEQISVATPEKKGLFYHAPSRNEALLWLVRTYTTSGQYNRARSLLSTLRADPAFPERLNGELAAQEAFFYYRQEQYDKCLPPLAAAMEGTSDKHLKTRWAFLAGQLYEAQHAADPAIRQYKRVIALHPDPLMAFYARLNIVQVNIREGHQDFSEGSEALLRMAHKAKYERYRGILYYSLARLALEADHPAEAAEYLQLSARYNAAQPALMARSFKLLADMYYDRGKYRAAKRFYDSTAAFMMKDLPGADLVTQRKEALTEVVKRLDVITRQDSLRMLAALPPATLEAQLQTIVDDSLKALRRRSRREAQLQPGNNNEANDLFGNTVNPAPGRQRNGSGGKDWYFYNAALKAGGFSAFKSRWGDRPLADNWRLGGGNNGNAVAAGGAGNASDSAAATAAESGQTDEPLSVATLMEAIPTTPEKMKRSDDSLIQAYYELATLYADRLENEQAAIRTLDTLLMRFPDNPFAAAALYRLSLLNARTDAPAKAAAYKKQLLARFPDNKYTSQQQSPAGPAPASLLYDSAYLDYLSGNYTAVLRQKAKADSLYPGNELLARFDLLRAMAIVKTQPDSGKAALTQVMTAYSADSAITGRAKAILDALNHKQTLIEHLAGLQLPEEAPAEKRTDTTQFITAKPQPLSNPAPDSTQLAVNNEQPGINNEQPGINNQQPVTNNQPSTTQAPDSTINKQPATGTPAPDSTINQQPEAPPTPYKVTTAEPHFVVLVFRRTDKQLLDEALKKFTAYNRQNHTADTVEVSPYILQNQFMLIFRLFRNERPARDYYREISAKAAAILPDIRPQEYTLFFISRDNFILLNNTKDLEGYIRFFKAHY